MAKKKRSAQGAKSDVTESAMDEKRNEIIAETVLGEMMQVTIKALKAMQMGWGALP